MSRRFGRNQKRAMRTQIRDLQREVHLRNIRNLDLSRDLTAANTVIERTYQVLGAHFVTLPVKTREVEEIVERYQVSIFQPDRSHLIQHKVMQSLNLIDVETHQSSVRADELRGTIHMRYRSVSGDVAYGLSDHAWRKLPESHLVDLIKNQIAPDMAKLLIREHKKRF